MAHEEKKKHKPAPMSLVRGPDGSLYLLTKTDAPKKLTDDEAKAVKNILEDVGDKLGRAIDDALPRLTMSQTHHLHISVPEVFMD